MLSVCESGVFRACSFGSEQRKWGRPPSLCSWRLPGWSPHLGPLGSLPPPPPPHAQADRRTADTGCWLPQAAVSWRQPCSGAGLAGHSPRADPGPGGDSGSSPRPPLLSLPQDAGEIQRGSGYSVQKGGNHAFITSTPPPAGPPPGSSVLPASAPPSPPRPRPPREQADGLRPLWPVSWLAVEGGPGCQHRGP